MYVQTKNYGNAIQKVRINIGLELGLEEAEEVFIEMKEMSTLDVIKLKKVTAEGDEYGVTLFWKETLPKVIVNHNLYIDEQTKMTNEQVIDLVFEKVELTGKVFDEYAHANFFTQGKRNVDK